ncbi:MAG: cupin domain-containing protein [Prochlorococcus sp.]|jgi:quercetin dioxygenase-like cupin family protein|nr:cupin domain-containing protein [Prochlorococcaceae cyanobacterium ETNP2_MAG_10]MDP6196100.1 cupin domain-containing protein [Prochlorococcaceae cyanobacterium ETNP18_MAG_17]MDP6322173.1 cupin domain-containing protein [Prochlorococcaceae cyanobacterium ETNP14_MAG_5]MDP6851678.1 cupin domain-containing protein [Prochlorococcaceae cyanobacterium ETNP1_MAG_8]
MHRFLLITLSAGISLSVVACSYKKEASLDTKAVTIETLTSSTESWGGDVYSYPKGKAQMTFQRITAQPGFKTPLHFHPQPGIAYVARGNLSCGMIDGQALKVGPGEAFATNQDSVHYCEVVSKEPALVFVAYAGVKGKPITLPYKK